MHSILNYPNTNYIYCYLIKIELKRSIIAELLNRSVSAITNSLSRLYQKIYSEKGTAQQMEGIIQEL